MAKRNNSKVQESVINTIDGSYKDPSGFVFTFQNKIYRTINKIYQQDYEMFMSSGLYQRLVDDKLLIAHREVDNKSFNITGENIYKIIQPEQITFISYPYEWSFSMLKDVALLTLKIQRLALEYNMTLKDASAYNITFFHGKPVFFDSLSFEKYVEGKPWVAYRQFCQHFLGPLALASYKDVRFIQMTRNYLDGYPLDLVSKLLPKKTLFNFNISAHIHAHSVSQTKLTNRKVALQGRGNISKQAFLNIIRSLTDTVSNLNLPKQQTEWEKYYQFTNYDNESFDQKKKLIKDYCRIVSKNLSKPVFVDIGANNGEFSRQINNPEALILSTDIDPLAVEWNYQLTISNKENNIIPLIIDLSNPSPAIGFGLNERLSFFDRINVDCYLALALIHHLCITYNLQSDQVARFFSKKAKFLIIEFIPKQDSQVKLLLQNRDDIFTEYDQDSFEKYFTRYFRIIKKENIKNSVRTLYLMEKN